MSNQLTDAELAALMPSELCAYQTPIPTQIVSSDEFYPDPQNERQREVEARLLAMADELGGKQGLSRRRPPEGRWRLRPRLAFPRRHAWDGRPALGETPCEPGMGGPRSQPSVRVRDFSRNQFLA